MFSALLKYVFAAEKRDVHVGLAQVVERRFEFGDLRALGALERVQVGPARTQEAVGRDQALHVHLLARHGQVGLAGLQREGVGLGALGEAFDHRRVRPRRGPRCRRWPARAGGCRSRCASCRARCRGCRGRPRTTLRRRGRCPRTGTSWTCTAASSFAHLSRRFPALRWVDQPSATPAAPGQRTSDPPCCLSRTSKGTGRTVVLSAANSITTPGRLRPAIGHLRALRFPDNGPPFGPGRTRPGLSRLRLPRAGTRMTGFATPRGRHHEVQAILAAAALAAAVALPAQAQTLRWAAQNDILTMDPHSQNHATTNAHPEARVRRPHALQRDLRGRARAGHEVDLRQPDAGALRTAQGRQVPRRHALHRRRRGVLLRPHQAAAGHDEDLRHRRQRGEEGRRPHGGPDPGRRPTRCCCARSSTSAS